MHHSHFVKWINLLPIALSLSWFANINAMDPPKKKELVTSEDLRELLEEFKKNEAQPHKKALIAAKALQLFSRDYEIDLCDQDVCPSYPPVLYIPYFSEALKFPRSSPPSDARFRDRFAVPILLTPEGKYLYRSSTLHTKASFLYQKNAIIDNEKLASIKHKDSQFLHDLKISHILNLMTEPNTVISDTLDFVGLRSEIGMKQEHTEQKYYNGIQLLDMPYPGCEYSAIYTQNGYCGLHCFPFKETGINLDSMSKLSFKEGLGVHWQDYAKWNLVEMTQNYLKAILALLKAKDSSSILIHCMSGWDRTPLMISLVRLSLWADGIIHQSLTPIEILYFTLAYDWMLFGHQLHDRMQKDEHIMHFTFYTLKFITDKAFSYENIAPDIKAEENLEAPKGKKSDRIISAKVGTRNSCSECTKTKSQRAPKNPFDSAGSTKDRQRLDRVRYLFNTNFSSPDLDR